MPKALDLTGQIFGRLTVLAKAHNKGVRTAWSCQCSCGSYCVVITSYLTSGDTKSCGCLQPELASVRNTKHGATKNGKWTGEYMSWSAMVARCTNPTNKKFHRYGGRGIKVDPDWLKFENFLRDMGPRPEDHTIERVDTDGDYTKSNCIWLHKSKQALNRSTNRMLSYNGETLPLSEMARRHGLTPFVLSSRINKYGWSLEEALTTSTGAKRNVRDQ